ncbi:MAG: response regulator [candidate division Zixibacteria bacterium]|nr:response regulator [candidate division Zixibacteria bacterium]
MTTGKDALPATAKGIHTILVVDDDPSIRQIMTDLLLLDGYEVTTAEDAQSALHILEQHAVDLLITDLGLPLMDGWDLAVAARRCHPQLGIMAISSWQGKDAPNKMAEHGIDLMVWKPFRFDQIRQAIVQTAGLLAARAADAR